MSFGRKQFLKVFLNIFTLFAEFLQTIQEDSNFCNSVKDCNLCESYRISVICWDYCTTNCELYIPSEVRYSRDAESGRPLIGGGLIQEKEKLSFRDALLENLDDEFDKKKQNFSAEIGVKDRRLYRRKTLKPLPSLKPIILRQPPLAHRAWTTRYPGQVVNVTPSYRIEELDISANVFRRHLIPNEASPVAKQSAGSGTALVSKIPCPRTPYYEPCVTAEYANKKVGQCCESSPLVPVSCYEFCTVEIDVVKLIRLYRSTECPFSAIKPTVYCIGLGKDHRPCCDDLGVPPPCNEFCSLKAPELNLASGIQCLPYLGRISKCFRGAINP